MSTPTINVNLKQCTCGYRISFAVPGTHFAGCPATLVLIPCPIPRSVTFEVVLGKCGRYALCAADTHVPACLARPVRVSCSISGKTWEESDVTSVDPYHDHAWTESALAACRERWALVKALLSGMSLNDWSVTRNTPEIVDRWNQRDAVFSALAKARWNEDGLNDATNEAVKAIGGGPLPAFGRRPSEELLARYVERLVEQVGCFHEAA